MIYQVQFLHELKIRGILETAMRQIGTYIREARLKKKYSLSHLEGMTRIKREFLDAIERESWEALPAFSVVSGFVKSIAKALELDEKQTSAFLRRDYPPKDIRINPKPDVSDRFFWTPKFTFFAGVFLIFALIVGYLGFQYVNFISPPKLEVIVPKEGQIVTRQFFNVEGKVSPDSTVKVNNQLATVEDDGSFSSQIEVSNILAEVVVSAVSRSGKETIIHRTIKPDLK